jgi:hypothetical protein
MLQRVVEVNVICNISHFEPTTMRGRRLFILPIFVRAGVSTCGHGHDGQEHMNMTRKYASSGIASILFQIENKYTISCSLPLPML